LEEQIGKLGIPLLGVVQADDELAQFETSGRPLVELGNESPVYRAVAEMMKQIL
jgi:CO dehydrogenase nickel-insertion accessory protein CooC1